MLADPQTFLFKAFGVLTSLGRATPPAIRQKLSPYGEEPFANSLEGHFMLIMSGQQLPSFHYGLAIISLMTSPAIISPATDGTKDRLPGI